MEIGLVEGAEVCWELYIPEGPREGVRGEELGWGLEREELRSARAACCGSLCSVPPGRSHIQSSETSKAAHWMGNLYPSPEHLGTSCFSLLTTSSLRTEDRGRSLLGIWFGSCRVGWKIQVLTENWRLVMRAEPAGAWQADFMKFRMR